MIDLTDFKKYKIAYFIIIQLAAFAIAVQSIPPYHNVIVDVAVEPPESARRTDFSWITVNEWFTTQIFLIKSDAILGKVRSGKDKDELKGIISAERLGSSNIIRISAFSGDDVEILKSMVGSIADLYLKEVGQPVKETPKLDKAVQFETEIAYDTLRGERARMADELEMVKSRMKSYETEIGKLNTALARLKEVRERIDQIDRELSPLKTNLLNLKLTYTDNWPAVVKIRTEIYTLENEKEKLASELPALQQSEAKKVKLSSMMDNDKKELDSLHKDLTTLDDRLAQLGQLPQNNQLVKQEGGSSGKKDQAPKSEVPANRIITMPTESMQRVFLIFVRRSFIAFLIGIAVWFLLGYMLNNFYLYWVLKDRLFKRR